MRSLPDSDYDTDELARLKAEPWMVEALSLNPSYPHWGPHEDYMSKDGQGWDSRQLFATWKDFGPWSLDDLNECVNFYFSIQRDSKQCESCEGSGYSPQAKRFSDQWYGRAPFDPAAYGAPALTVDNPIIRENAERNVNRSPEFYGRDPSAVRREQMRLWRDCYANRWSHNLIQADVDALLKAERLWDFTRTRRPETPADAAQHENGWLKEGNGHVPTPEDVNAWSLKGLGHDAINHDVCVRARCEREGVPLHCPDCEGHGHVYTSPAGHLSLTLWWLHPRKGCSRGVEIATLTRDDFRAAVKFLADAARRNSDRFGKVTDIASDQ